MGPQDRQEKFPNLQVPTNKHPTNQKLPRPPQLQAPQHRNRQHQYIKINDHTRHRARNIQRVRIPTKPLRFRFPVFNHWRAEEQAANDRGNPPENDEQVADPEGVAEGSRIRGEDALVEEEGGGFCESEAGVAEPVVYEEDAEELFELREVDSLELIDFSSFLFIHVCLGEMEDLMGFLRTFMCRPNPRSIRYSSRQLLATLNGCFSHTGCKHVSRQTIQLRR